MRCASHIWLTQASGMRQQPQLSAGSARHTTSSASRHRPFCRFVSDESVNCKYSDAHHGPSHPPDAAATRFMVWRAGAPPAAEQHTSDRQRHVDHTRQPKGSSQITTLPPRPPASHGASFSAAPPPPQRQHCSQPAAPPQPWPDRPWHSSIQRHAALHSKRAHISTKHPRQQLAASSIAAATAGRQTRWRIWRGCLAAARIWMSQPTPSRSMGEDSDGWPLRASTLVG